MVLFLCFLSFAESLYKHWRCGAAPVRQHSSLVRRLFQCPQTLSAAARGSLRVRRRTFLTVGVSLDAMRRTRARARSRAVSHVAGGTQLNALRESIYLSMIDLVLK